MKIMHLIGGGDVGGAKTHVLTLVASMAKTNDIRLISFREGQFAQDAAAAGIDTTVIHNKMPLSDVRMLLHEIDAFQPDMLHCHGAKANTMGVVMKALRGIPVVTTVHSDYRLDYMHSKIKQFTFGALNTVALRMLDYRVTVSDSLARMLIERGFDPQKIFPLNNGISFEGETPHVDRAAYYRALGFSCREEDVVIGVAARLTAVKDIRSLIHAFASAASKFPDLRLAIAGEGEESAALRALALELGVQDKVWFLGWVRGMAEFFSTVQINVLCSLSEGFPYSVLEGAREKCATIVSSVGALPDVVTNGVDGLVFRPGDVDALTAAIEKLAADKKLRTDMASHFYEKASREFSLDATCVRQQEIYEIVLRREDKGRRGAVICGAYGRGNSGDEAILKAIITEMNEIDPDMPLFVTSRSPDETRLINRVNSFYIFNVPAFLYRLARAKIFINGGGSLIQDSTSSRSLYFYLFTLWAAKHLGCRIIMYGCGIGPVHEERNRRAAARILNQSVDIITLRDDTSRDELVRMGVTKPDIRIAADPTMNIVPAPDVQTDAAFAVEGIPPHGRYICFCLRSWRTFDQPESITRAAEYAYARYGLTPVFLPIEMPKDIAPAQSAADGLKIPHYVIRNRYPVDVTIAMISRMQTVAAMRLHALVFAAIGGVPVIGISYDVKVDSFIKYIGSKLCIPLEELSEEKLCAAIDAAQGRRNDGSAAQTSVRLRMLEKRNIEAARELLSGSGTTQKKKGNHNG